MTRHLIVLPSPAMAGVPVETLTDRHLVSYAPSGTLFAWLREKTEDAAGGSLSLLAVGDPTFPRPDPRFADARGDFAPLPHTRREVDTLSNLFRERQGKVVTLLGERASEEELRQLAAAGRLRDFRYLHLATHARSDPRGGLGSFLVLAHAPAADQQADDRIHDGRLSAADILRTWRLDADLVTLSACQTGLGRYQAGEGYVGFAQALFLAGARCLVLQPWPVDDRATALLMSRFYQNLLGTRDGLVGPLPRAAALAEAKAWLRDLTEEEVSRLALAAPGGSRGGLVRVAPPEATPRPYSHPYYWAGFLLVGDPGDVSTAVPVLAARSAGEAVPATTGRLYRYGAAVLGGLAVLAALAAGGTEWRRRRRG